VKFSHVHRNSKFSVHSAANYSVTRSKYFVTIFSLYNVHKNMCTIACSSFFRGNHLKFLGRTFLGEQREEEMQLKYFRNGMAHKNKCGFILT